MYCKNKKWNTNSPPSQQSTRYLQKNQHSSSLLYNSNNCRKFNNNNDIYCNNCGNIGHIGIKCKMPIISCGIIAYRINSNTNVCEYLMMRRKHTLGYMDFVRGKTPVDNRLYYLNMFTQMTIEEKNKLRTICNMTPKEINNISNPMFGKNLKEKMIQLNFGIPYSSEQIYFSEENNDTNNWFLSLVKTRTLDKSTDTSKDITSTDKLKDTSTDKLKNTSKDITSTDKLKDTSTDKLKNTSKDKYTMKSLIDESDLYGQWNEPEWGFPKGRRNFSEADYNCALREFYEETGLNVNIFENIRNIMPFEETFYGSNNKLYKHKYFLMKGDFNTTLIADYTKYQSCEVSAIKWNTIDECINNIRPYNIEKKKVILNIHNFISSINMHTIC